jgi:hypothetical protein
MGLFSGRPAGAFRYNEADNGASLYVNPDAQRRYDRRQARVARMTPRQAARDRARQQRDADKLCRDIDEGKYG